MIIADSFMYSWVFHPFFFCKAS